MYTELGFVLIVVAYRPWICSDCCCIQFSVYRAWTLIPVATTFGFIALEVYLLSLLLLLFLVHCVFRPECVIVAVWALKRQVTTSTVAKIVKDIYHSAVSLTLVRG